MTEHSHNDQNPRHAGADGTTATAPRRYGRRALILGAAGAGAGAAAALAGGTTPAGAQPDSGPYVTLGGDATVNAETRTTTIFNPAGGAFAGNTSANGGHAGVHGNDTSTAGGYGVAGSSTNGYGVTGSSTNGTGVRGTTSADGGSGVAGIDASGLDLSSGVSGTSTIGYGVSGSCPNGVAIYGESTNGYAVYASAPGGTGLLVQGKSVFQGMTEFSNSGVATVKKNDKSVTVKVAGVRAGSIVLATLQELRAGIAVAAAVPTAGSFTITLTGKVHSDIKVGWFVTG
jgi:hypothetical protein